MINPRIRTLFALCLWCAAVPARAQTALIDDPIKALVDSASGRDVDTVIVDGRVLVQGGRTTRVDEDAIYAKARAATEHYWARVPEWRWDGATVDRIVPPAFPIHRAGR